jgi:hypothetical protein
MAYIAPPVQEERLRTFKRRVYSTMRTISVAENVPRLMRITQIRPSKEWTLVWKILHAASVSEEARTTWYFVIHDIVPPNECLHKIRLADSNLCRHCERQDSLEHRLAECGEGTAISKWTKERIAWLLRTDPRRITADWILRPQFQLWPPQRHQEVLWTLTDLVLYQMQKR